MFEKGAMIIYGSNGVCRVEEVSEMDLTGSGNSKLYYTLSQIGRAGGRIYTPTDNEKVVMRPVISRDEALSLIDEIEEMDVLTIISEKTREAEYKEAIHTCDPHEYVRVLKTIHVRMLERIAEGKKVTALDEKYYALAEKNLVSELAVALGMEQNDARTCVVTRVGGLLEA